MQPDWMLQKNNSPTYSFMCFIDISDLLQTLESGLTSSWNFPAVLHGQFRLCFVSAIFPWKRSCLLVLHYLCRYLVYTVRLSLLKISHWIFWKKRCNKTSRKMSFLTTTKEKIARATCCVRLSARLACLYLSFLCFVVALLTVNYHLVCFFPI